MALPLRACATLFTIHASTLLCLLANTHTDGRVYLQVRSIIRLGARHDKSPCTQVMSSTSTYRVRECHGGDDYSAVIGSVDAWWGGRRVSPMLPRLFFENFCGTSFVVTTTADIAGPRNSPSQERPTAANEDHCKGERDEIIVGFLCGFVSQSRTGEVRQGPDVRE